MNEFSLWLGLLDYGNPIAFTLLFTFLLKTIKSKLSKEDVVILTFGAVMSLFGGFFIPTGKCIVGLKFHDWVMPSEIVCMVNCGFFIAGTTLVKSLKDRKWETKNYVRYFLLVVLLIYLPFFIELLKPDFKKVVVANIVGLVGMVCIYIYISVESLRQKKVFPMVLVIVSFLLSTALSGIGSKMDLDNALVHWLIEALAVTCHFCAYISARLVFKEK